jgi:heme oxygenase
MNQHPSEFYFPKSSPGTSDLRLKTQASHREVEQTLALPASIQTLADYRRWLIRFLGLYGPLEARLSTFSQWSDWGICIEDVGHSASLRRDIRALGTNVQDIPQATPSALPSIQTFSNAFGALYVLEGSKLGGKFILRDLADRLGPAIEGASAFFTGHGEKSGLSWNAFRQSLDAYLIRYPLEFPEVAAGAESTFAAVQAWMLAARNPFRSGAQLEAGAA